MDLDMDYDPTRFDASGERDSPPSLQDIALNLICDHIDRLTVPERDSLSDDQIRFVAPAGGVYLPPPLSEQLLERLCSRGLLNDSTLSLFDASSTRLRRLRIKDATHVGPGGVKRILCVGGGHKLTEMTIHGLRKASVTCLVESFNEWTLDSLRVMNVSDCSLKLPSSSLGRPALELSCFSSLRNLSSLNVSRTSFNRLALEAAVRDLPLLDALDVSLTKVTDVRCLEGTVAHRLKLLNLHGLRLNPSGVPRTVQMLSTMSCLQHLDVSDETGNRHPLDALTDGDAKIPAGPLLWAAAEGLPVLRSLDLSGKDDLDGETELLLRFVDRHPELCYLGLVFADGAASAMVHHPRSHSLAVGGTATEVQLMEMLSRYGDRPSYVQKAFYHLFRSSQSWVSVSASLSRRAEAIRCVARCATGPRCRPSFGIQLAATACLYNLSRGESCERLHPRLLRLVVETDLDAMAAFPGHRQLQKNVLLTLCNDRMLQEVSFGRSRCARLVLDCLCAWPDDSSMTRMSVAVCSILAAKISTAETSKLGSDSGYMARLLSVVRGRVESAEMDLTLRFALSALWNLTDESPDTCRAFLAGGGIQLFVEALEAFADEAAVETKVLGLINNVAEVESLRPSVMDERLVRRLVRTLLRSKHVEVSYFAAGVAAHLASRYRCHQGEAAWAVESVTREEVTDSLAEAVSRWETPKAEMVAYRSFAPFFPLLALDQHPAVQLWAAWAVHHVCSKNHRKYCPKLVEQGGPRVLLSLVEEHKSSRSSSLPSSLASIQSTVVKLCQDIVDVAVNHSHLSHSDVRSIQQEIEAGLIFRADEPATPIQIDEDRVRSMN